MNQPKWRSLLTEQINSKSLELDSLTALEIVDLINSEDALAVQAVAAERENIAMAIEEIAGRLQSDGRLFYIGAGTSGRLGALDAAECPPTFGIDPAKVQAIVAGGDEALQRSIEDAEDNEQDGREQIARYEIGSNDVVVGISASGVAPFVRAGLTEAGIRDAFTILLTCNAQDTDTIISADVVIAPITGPEVLTGSTRMKAGTATKLILNMISTGVMVRLGKCYGNLMIDVQPASAKLRDRAIRIVARATGLDESQAQEILNAADRNAKVAIVMARLDVNCDEAKQQLAEQRGNLRAVIGKGPHYVTEFGND